MKNIPLTEHQIQDLLIEYLQLKGYYVQRMNSGQMKANSVKKVRYGKREFEVPTERTIMMGVAGTPDIMAFRLDYNDRPRFKYNHLKLYFIEVKRPGKKPTPIQKAKMQELERYGAKCLVATSLEDLQEAGI